MNTIDVLLNYVIPILCGYILVTLLFNMHYLAEWVVWVFDFKGRRAYRKAMKSVPTLSVKREFDNVWYLRFTFSEPGIYAVIFMHNDGEIKVGLFNECMDECLFSGFIERKKLALIDHLTKQ